jgi:hypothetical protein
VLQWVARRGDGHPALANVDLSKVVTSGIRALPSPLSPFNMDVCTISRARAPNTTGDSAGGNLAAVLSLMAVERQSAVRVAYQLLIYPTCLAPPTPSAIEFADGKVAPQWVPGVIFWMMMIILIIIMMIRITIMTLNICSIYSAQVGDQVLQDAIPVGARPLHRGPSLPEPFQGHLPRPGPCHAHRRR